MILLQMRQFLLADGRQAVAPQHSADGFYDKRAFAILKEAANLGCLPSFKLGKAGLIDLRGVPPIVAEVFFLDVLAGVVDGDPRCVWRPLLAGPLPTLSLNPTAAFRRRGCCPPARIAS